MNFEELKAELVNFLATDKCNYIQPEDAMRDDLVGMRIFDDPVFKVARADDPLFLDLKNESAFGDFYKLPEEWTPGAKSVISYFFPISERVRNANAVDLSWPADEWLHCRIEGQEANDVFSEFFCEKLRAAGFSVSAPSIDERLIEDIGNFTTNWSERHTAFICGHGTFGMSRGLITDRGVAGRFGSVVTDLELPADTRDYTERYEYCIECGLCAKNCPADAIDTSLPLDEAKCHVKCRGFQGPIRNLPPRGKSQKMRYGCGKCQVAVPCELKRPAKKT